MADKRHEGTTGNAMSNLSGGRINQKLRTRNSLVEAAAELMRENRDFSVADVADLAKVGRTTAYRYFPNIETLIAHAALYAIADVERRNVNVALDRSSTPEGRLRAVIQTSDHAVLDYENLFRAMLSLSVTGNDTDPDMLPRRVGVRRALLESAISPLRSTLGKKSYDRLIAALSMYVGIESLVVLRDVCQLPDDKAREVKLWAATTLLNAAVAEAESQRSSKSASKPAPSDDN